MRYRLTMALQRLDETETLMGDLVAQRGGTTPRAVIAQLKANLELRKLCATPLPEEVRG